MTETASRKLKGQLSGFAGHVLGNLNWLKFRFREFDIGDTIILSGTPKSGSTWVADVLSRIPEYTVLLEPLNPEWFPEARKAGFKPRTYKTSCADWPQGEEYLRQVLSGHAKTVSYHPLAIRSILSGFMNSKILAKFVRANRLIPWISQRFPVRSMVLVIRHPCAVVASQMGTGTTGYKSKYGYMLRFKRLPKPEELVEEAQEIEYMDRAVPGRLKHIQTLEETLAAIWCLDNYVPLFFPGPRPWITVFYEKLFSEGEAEIRRVFDKLQVDTPQSAIRQLNIPSFTASVGKALGEDQLSKWRKHLSSEQIKNILEIVAIFGLDFYTENLKPDYSRLCHLM